MNAQLQTRNGNTAIATEAPADYIPVAGLENLSPEDFSIPSMKLVQTNTKGIENVTEIAGQWYRTDTGEAVAEIDVLIIGIQKSRILFKSDYDGGETKALCRSDDSITPRAEFIGASVSYIAGSENRKAIVSPAEGNQFDMVLPATCGICPLAQWGKHNEPPACRLTDGWGALTPECDPVLLRFGGSSARVSEKLRNLARAAMMKRKPLYVKLSSHFEDKGKGQYYVPDIMLIKDAVPTDLIDTASAFIGLNLAARASEMMSDDEEATSATTTTRNAAPQSNEPDWSHVHDAAEFDEDAPF